MRNVSSDFQHVDRWSRIDCDVLNERVPLLLLGRVSRESRTERIRRNRQYLYFSQSEGCRDRTRRLALLEFARLSLCELPGSDLDKSQQRRAHQPGKQRFQFEMIVLW